MLVTFRVSALGFGGTERVFLSVADYLSTAHGWQINFVIDQINGSETEQIAKEKGYNVIGLNASRTWKTIVPFATYLRVSKPDIVLSAYPETNGAALISNAFLGFHTPMIITEHSALDESWRGKSKLKRMVRELIIRHGYKSADHILCVSRGLSDQLRKKIVHSQISYIHNPTRFALRTRSKVDARRELNVPEEVHMVLAVGRICRQKNYLMLLEAFCTLRPSDNHHLYIVGGVYEKDEKERVDQLIDQQGLTSRIHFIGFTEEVQLYYEAADMLVLSSAWEGFGNVLVEAMAFGLPIVSTRCNYGPAEILDDGEYGILVEVGDSAAMGQAIQRISENNPFDAQRQIQRAQAFTESRIGEQYFQLISNITGYTA